MSVIEIPLCQRFGGGIAVNEFAQVHRLEPCGRQLLTVDRYPYDARIIFIGMMSMLSNIVFLSYVCTGSASTPSSL